MARKSLSFLKNKNRNFDNVLDSYVNLDDCLTGTTTLPMGLNVVKGGITTLATDGTTTVSSAISQPANTILMGVGILCTTAFTIGSGADMGINVGTASNGSNSSIVALDADAIYSNATAGLALNAVVTSFGGGPAGESGITGTGAGVGISLVANAAVHTTTARDLYFKTTSSSGNPTAGAYRPLLFVIRIA
jgi:hypothetical protein